MYCVLDCISKIFWKFTSSTGNEEMRFHYQRGYDQRYNEILVFITMNKRSTNISKNQKTLTLSTTQCHNHYHNQTIIIIIIIIVVVVVVIREFKMPGRQT